MLLIGAGAYAATIIKFGNLNKDLTGKVSQYNISSNAANMALNHRIVNVAIFGVDGRDDVDGSRSDSMMIASADFEHNKLKITSLMRDTYVYINKDYGYDKLNAAYSFGGPELALKTINQNFDTAITDYVTIDFTAMVAMVNAVGGVTIDIENEGCRRKPGTGLLSCPLCWKRRLRPYTSPEKGFRTGHGQGNGLKSIGTIQFTDKSYALC